MATSRAVDDDARTHACAALHDKWPAHPTFATIPLWPERANMMDYTCATLPLQAINTFPAQLGKYNGPRTSRYCFDPNARGYNGPQVCRDNVSFQIQWAECPLQSLVLTRGLFPSFLRNDFDWFRLDIRVYMCACLIVLHVSRVLRYRVSNLN